MGSFFLFLFKKDAEPRKKIRTWNTHSTIDKNNSDIFFSAGRNFILERHPRPIRVARSSTSQSSKETTQCGFCFWCMSFSLKLLATRTVYTSPSPAKRATKSLGRSRGENWRKHHLGVIWSIFTFWYFLIVGRLFYRILPVSRLISVYKWLKNAFQTTKAHFA